MKRRHFLKYIPALSFAATFPNVFSFINSTPLFSKEELIGRKKPPLYGKGYQLRKEAHQAFEEMKKAALAENISIYIVSSYRSYAHQKRIWEKKYKNYRTEGFSPQESIEKIILYSTIPGTSRHHWGTDIDIIDANATHPKHVLEQENYSNNGPYAKLKEWTDKHAEKFGFYEVYTPTEGRKGFNPEPWHFSYAPTAIPMLNAYQALNLPKVLSQYTMLGSDCFSTNFIEKYTTEYILGINPELLPMLK